MIALTFVLGAPGTPTVELGTSRDVAVPVVGQVFWMESSRWADGSSVRGRRWFRVLDVGFGYTDNGSRRADHYLAAEKTVYLEEVDAP